jgi:hypothetical protein
MVTVILQGGVLISTLAMHAQHVQSCYGVVFQEPNDCNCQQLHFIPHLIQIVE